MKQLNMKNKKILILNGSHSEIPLILAAKKLGFYVISGGRELNLPGHDISDHQILVDYSDRKAVLKVARELEIDAICPCCNDFSIFTAQYVAQKLNLKSNFDDRLTLEILHHKDKFRDFMSANELPSPKAKKFYSAKEAIKIIVDWKFPLLIKPIDLSGGKGITKIDDISKAEEAIVKALLISRENSIVIEEYIAGSNHGFSALIKNKMIESFYLDDELYYENPFLVSAAHTSSIKSKNIIDNLIKQSETICNILNLVDGIFHIQFILSKDGPVIVEITRRPPGDMYLKLVEMAKLPDYSQHIVNNYTGHDNFYFDKSFTSTKKIIRHCIMSNTNGVVKRIKYSDGIEKKIVYMKILGEIGDYIDDYMTYKYGIVFIEYNKFNDLFNSSPKMQEMIKLVVE